MSIPSFCIVFSILTWSSAFVSIRYVVGFVSPEHLFLLRYLIASVLMLCVVFSTGKMREVRNLFTKKSIALTLLSSLCGITLYNLFLNYAEQQLDAALSAFIIAQTPLISIILAVFFLGEGLNRRNITGIVVSTAGVILIFLSARLNGMVTGKGIVLICLATLCNGVFITVQKPLTRIASPTMVIAMTIWIGTLFILPFSLGAFKTFSSVPPSVMMNIVYLGVFPAALAYLSWSYVISKKGVKKVVPACYAIPFISSLLAFVFLHEHIHLLSIAGGIIAVLGIYISSIKQDGTVRMRRRLL